MTDDSVTDTSRMGRHSPAPRVVDPADAARAVQRTVRAHLADLDEGSLVLIACSGGPDSLVLAKAAGTLTVKPETPWRAGAIVIDHGLQPGSAAVAQAAAHHCRAFGLDPVEVIAVDIDPGAPGQGGLEAVARDARRTALMQAAERHGAAAICLAHTRDDQAETVLLRLARGSGARSLGAMAPVAGIWRRPLLALDRATVHAALGDLQPWVDPHNADARFARVRVRHDALPALVDALGTGVVEGLVRSAELLRDDADALDAMAAEVWEECRSESAGAGERVIELDVAVLARTHRAIRTRVLRRACLELGAPAAAVSFEHVRAIDALICDWHGQGPLDLPGSLRVSRGCGRLRFDRSDLLGSTPRA